MKYEAIVVHFGEIWLKGRNRGNFIKLLHSNITDALSGTGFDKIEDSRDRFIIRLDSKSKINEISSRLSHVFGISWFAPVIFSGNKPDQIIKAVAELRKGKESEPIRLVVKRSDKTLDYTSQELVGLFLKERESLSFQIDKDSKVEVFIAARKNGALIRSEKIRGLGGLPVGSSGKAVVMLSGGIDSPVAAFYAMKKGLAPVYVHMHAFADNEHAAKSKMKDLLAVLRSYYKARIYYLPAHIFQSAAIKVPKEYELVLFKHFLYKIAEAVAKQEDAETLVSGESLGQVASQTVKNIRAASGGIDLFAMRPLIGFDKQEIIDAAKKLGTYDISTKEYPDVCSLRAKHPKTGASYAKVKALYDDCNLDEALERTLDKALVA